MPQTSGTARLRVLARRRSGRVRSLRSRWRRAFALLAAVVMLSGTASILAIQLIVDSFRGSAVAIEQETTSSADLRNEIVAGVITFSSPITATQQTQEAAAVAAIDADYAADLLKMKSESARTLLAASLVKWNALIAARGASRYTAESGTFRYLALRRASPKRAAGLSRAGTPSASSPACLRSSAKPPYINGFGGA